MLRCPECNARLARARSPFGIVYHCASCGGRMVGLATLRRDRVAKPFRNELWQRARSTPGGSRCCPHCNRYMNRVQMPPEHGGVELDVCLPCGCVWFDTSEYKATPHSAAPPAPVKKEKLFASPRAREAAALMDLETVKRRQEREAAGDRDEGPQEAWKILPAVLGMPVECDVPPLSTRPLATWGLSAAVVAAFLLTVGGLGAAVRDFGFVPAEWSRGGGLTTLSSFFIHAGWMHLIGNVYFLMVFGDNVEDQLGKGKFLLLVLAGHAAGMVLHAALDPRGGIPCVGASAGIFAVVTYYAIAFPRARLAFFLFGRFRAGWLRVPAWAMLAFYTVLQLAGAGAQMQGAGSTSNLGHLGGMVIGAIAAIVARGVRRREQRGENWDYPR